MKTDRRGFTLIELIVVIVILGVMTAVISISVTTLPSTRAKGCATDISDALDRCRVGCLTHASAEMTLSVNAKSKLEINYYENGTLRDTRELGSSGVTVSDGTTTLPSGTASSDEITLSFTRTGAVSDGNDHTLTVTGGGRSYTITVVGATGSHEIS